MLSGANHCNCQICREFLAEVAPLQSSANSSKGKSRRIQSLITICYEAIQLLFDDCFLPYSRNLGPALNATTDCYIFVKQQLVFSYPSTSPFGGLTLPLTDAMQQAPEGYNDSAGVNDPLQQLSKQIAPLKKQNGNARDMGDILEALVILLKPLRTCATQLPVNQKALSQEDAVYKSFLTVCGRVLAPEITAANSKLKTVFAENGGIFGFNTSSKLDECFIKFLVSWIQAFNINSGSATMATVTTPLSIPTPSQSTMYPQSTASTSPSPATPPLRHGVSQESGLDDPFSDEYLLGLPMSPSRESGLNNSEASSLSSASLPPRINAMLISVTDVATLAEVQQLQLSKTEMVYKKIIQEILQFNQVLMLQKCVFTYKDVADVFHQYREQAKVMLDGDYSDAALNSLIDMLFNLSSRDFDFEYYQTAMVKDQLASCTQKKNPGKNKSDWKQNKEYFALLLAMLETLYGVNSCISRLQNGTAMRLVSLRKNAQMYTLSQDGTITTRSSLSSSSGPSLEQTYCAMVQLKSMIESRLFGYRLKSIESQRAIDQIEEYENILLSCNRDLDALAVKLPTLKQQYNTESAKGFFSRDRSRITFLGKEIKQAQEKTEQTLLQLKIVGEALSSFKSKLFACYLKDTHSLKKEMVALANERAIWARARTDAAAALEKLLDVNPALKNIDVAAIKNATPPTIEELIDVRDMEGAVLKTGKWRDIDRELGMGLQKLGKAIDDYKQTLSPADARKVTNSNLVYFLKSKCKANI